MGPPNPPFGSDERGGAAGPWDAAPGMAADGSGVRCPACGYDLTGVTIGSRCPECGEAVGRAMFQRSAGLTSGWAVASMVLGIVSIVGCVTYGLVSIPCGPLAIYFWWKAKQDLAAGRDGGGSAGMATAGLVTGIIGTVIGLTCVSAIAFAIISEM